MRVPWIERISKPLILNENIPKYSLEGLMLQLKLQYFGHLMQRADSFAKTLMLGNSDILLFSWAPKSLLMVITAMKIKDACFLEEKL